MTDFCLLGYTRQPEHDAIESEIEAFTRRGGKIQSIPRGVSGTSDGLYGSMAHRLRKTKKPRIPDFPDEEFEA